ncbi:MAG: hypothetical protein IT555_12990 [Acetobacteraceae bacterium]|nr:hypothetical protein [Acetobacteraceae bacterium]
MGDAGAQWRGRRMNLRFNPPGEPPQVGSNAAVRRQRPRAPDQLLPIVSLSDLAEIVWRRIWSIILITVLSILLTLGYLQLIRGDLYMAEAKLLVRIGQEQAPSPTMIDRSMLFSAQTGYATAEMEMLRSRDLISALIDRIDLTEQPRPPPTSLFGLVKETVRRWWRQLKEAFDEAMIWAGLKPRLTERELAIEAVSKALLVEATPNSNIFTARLFWPQRGAPELMLKMLVDRYLSHRATLFQGTTATNFFGERRRETAARLLETEQALGAYEREHGISNPDDQRTALLRRLSDADTGVDAARLDLQLAQTALAQLRAADQSGHDELASFAVAQSGSVLQQTLAGELATAAARLLAAQTTAGAQDLTIRRLQASMRALSRALAQQLGATAEQRRVQLAMRERQREEIRLRLQTLQDDIGRWQELKRDVASAARAYDFNDNKLNEATGIAALEAARLGNVVVVQSPSEQATPVGVRKSSMLAFAAVGGLMLALTWVVLREFFDHRLKTPGDVERRLNLRLLAAVPQGRRGFGVGRPIDPAADAVLARTAAALGRYVSEEGMRVLVVTAGADGEGASTVCAHVGRHMAGLLGLRVLLVDMGGRRPGLREYVAGLARPPAMVVLDAERPDPGIFARADGWAIADFDAVSDATGGRPSLDALIAAAGEQFDLVMIDAPPWQSGAETLLAIRACTHVMLVAAANSLSWEPLERLCADLEEERVELVGCVLNRYRRYLPRWLHEVLR